jgi:ketosteroid isomerase-like protein
VEEARGDARLSELSADVELIHRMAAAIERKDLGEAQSLLDPEVVWEHNLGEGSPEEGVYRGRDEVMDLYRRLLEVWHEIRIDLSDIRATGPQSFEVRGTMHFSHAASETEIAMPYVQKFELRDGRVAHVRLNVSTGRVMPA